MSDAIAKADLVTMLARFYRSFEGERARQTEAGREIFAMRARGGQAAIEAISYELGIAEDVQKCTGLGTMQ